MPPPPPPPPPAPAGPAPPGAIARPPRRGQAPHPPSPASGNRLASGWGEGASLRGQGGPGGQERPLAGAAAEGGARRANHGGRRGAREKEHATSERGEGPGGFGWKNALSLLVAG